MNYEIKQFNRSAGAVEVRFWTDEYPKGITYSIDVPIENGAFVIGDALATHIMQFAPYGQLQRLVDIAKADATAIEVIAPVVTQ